MKQSRIRPRFLYDNNLQQRTGQWFQLGVDLEGDALEADDAKARPSECQLILHVYVINIRNDDYHYYRAL